MPAVKITNKPIGIPGDDTHFLVTQPELPEGYTPTGQETEEELAELKVESVREIEMDDMVELIQDKLDMDVTPTTGSSKPVTSGGIKAALDLMDDDISSLNEDITNRVNALALDLTGAVKRIDDIEEAEGLKRYGVSGIGQAATTLTRILDSVGMVAQVGTDGDNSGVVNDFDNVTPFNRRKCVGEWQLKDGKPFFKVNAYLGDEDYAEDGSMGDYVAVECPRAYYSMENGALIISAHKYPGFRPFDIFCRNHNESDTIPFYYKNAYALALKDGKAVSLPGLDNAAGSYAELLEAARTYKDGILGNSAILMPAAYNFYEWALFTVEFATTNCQSVMQGCSGLRHNADDRVSFYNLILDTNGETTEYVDTTKAITNNFYAARVPGEYVCITPDNIDNNNKTYLATHRIVSVTRCDEDGLPDATGTHQLLELEDLGKNYWEYSGAASYRIAVRPYRTGACNGVSTPSGSPVSNSDTYHPCRYRWHENPFGNQYKTAVDLFDVRVGTGDDDWTLDWYFLIDPAGFATKNPAIADLETEDFIKLDVSTEHENYRGGYIRSKKHSKLYPDIWIPYETTGGSASTYYSDYASLVYSSLVRSVRFGGSWSNGASDGFSNALAYFAPSSGYASSGGDLCIAQ